MSTERDGSSTTIDTGTQRELLRVIAGLRFGAVEVTVHDGRVVQIERREKIRLAEPGAGRVTRS